MARGPHFSYIETCHERPPSSETTSHLRPQFGCTNVVFSSIFNLSSERCTYKSLQWPPVQVADSHLGRLKWPTRPFRPGL